jgi:hypothetical protein
MCRHYRGRLRSIALRLGGHYGAVFIPDYLSSDSTLAQTIVFLFSLQAGCKRSDDFATRANA